MAPIAEPNLRPLPIYATYLSFERAMDQLQRDGLPPRVRADAITAVQQINTARRLVAGFRAIGWIDEDGTPSAELQSLVKARNTADWQNVLRSALRRVYSFLPTEWDQLTPSRLSKAFQDYTGRNDDALKGAETFFLAAAIDAGVPLATELTIRANRAREDSSARFRKDAGQAVGQVTPTLPGPRLNGGGGERHADAELARVWDLLALMDDPEMTDKEKSAAFTVLAYLRRRADRKRGSRV